MRRIATLLRGQLVTSTNRKALGPHRQSRFALAVAMAACLRAAARTISCHNSSQSAVCGNRNRPEAGYDTCMPGRSGSARLAREGQSITFGGFRSDVPRTAVFNRPPRPRERTGTCTVEFAATPAAGANRNDQSSQCYVGAKGREKRE
jgi:hypothetical protein